MKHERTLPEARPPEAESRVGDAYLLVVVVWAPVDASAAAS